MELLVVGLVVAWSVISIPLAVLVGRSIHGVAAEAASTVTVADAA